MRKLSLGVALLGAVAPNPLAFAADTDPGEIVALREQLRTLEQHLRVLARQQELRDEAAAAAPPARVTINDRGFTLASADGANSLRLRGLVQLDARQFFDDGGLTNNAFVLRRARVISEGQLARRFGFQFVAEFGGSSVSILDANLTAALTPNVQLKLGKFKSPIGLEQLQSDAWTFFNERSLVTGLVPNRDLGIQAQVTAFDARLTYQVGVFNGVADGASTNNTDFDDDKDFASRIIATPFANEAGHLLQGLSFGVAGSIGREKTASGRTASYRTDGQQTYFTYLASTIADGQSWRVSPQFDFRAGSLGLLGEYVVSTVNVRSAPAAPIVELQNTGWQLAAGYVLTGENSSSNGVVPRTQFDWADGTWGAVEVVARYTRVEIDDAAFPLFAAPAASARRATSIGLGLNWYLSKAAMIKFGYYQTDFDFSRLAPAHPTAAVLRQDEKVFITRFQLTF